MPELPEVETVRRGIAPHVRGKHIVKVTIPPDPRGVRTLRRVSSVPGFRKQLAGREIKRVARRGKYLLFELDSGDTLILHLGMSGRLLKRRRKYPPDPFTRIVFLLEGDLELRLADPRKFGEAYLLSAERGETRVNPHRLGIEPLDRGFTADWLFSRLAGSSRAIKTALLDQGLIAGIGNIYSDEILFASRIRPDRPASSLNRSEVERIVLHTRRILKKAIEKRGTTAGDGTYRDSRNRMGSYQNELSVYALDGKPCPRCRREIDSRTIGGRTAHFCPSCQK